MTGRAIVLALALALPPAAAAAETLTVAVSTNDIRIDSNFDGAAVTVFGVIERDATTVSRAATYEVAVVLRGPSEQVVARRKDRFLGVWVNRASETFGAAPSFYALATSADLDQVSSEPLLDRFGIGFDHVALEPVDPPAAGDPAILEFRKAFIRLKQEAGLYRAAEGGVSFIGDAVFRATLDVPANMPDGIYTVDVYLFSGSALLAEKRETIRAVKTGIEQYLYAAATGQSLAYGAACVLLALLTGWLAGVIFRRD